MQNILCAGYILIIDVGAHLAWTSPALPHLTNGKTKFSVTNDQGAWLASVVSLSAMIGYVTNSLIVDRIGRRFTLLIFAISHLGSWISINCAYNYNFLIIARLAAGFSLGGTYSFLPPYIGEVSEKKIRGTFLAFDRIGVNLGAFLVTALGAFFSYETMNLVMILVPTLAICLFPLMVETPYYYLMQGQDDKAVKILMKLSGVKRSDIIMPNIRRMKEAMENQNSQSSSIQELMKDRGSRKALIIVLLAYMTYAFSGTIAIQAYAQVIFKQSSSSLGSEYAAMIITGVQIFSGLPSSKLIDHWGRRPIYLFSGILSAISLGIVGLFFFLKDYLGTDISRVTWLPLVGLVLYQFMCNCGISTIPTVLVGEIFSVKVKTTAVLIASVIVALFLFTTKMMTPFLNDSVGIYTTFWIFSGFCLCGPLIIVYITPETKGKNLEEVLILMRGEKEKRRINISRAVKLKNMKNLQEV